jgi:hypothetical protein
MRKNDWEDRVPGRSANLAQAHSPGGEHRERTLRVDEGGGQITEAADEAPMAVDTLGGRMHVHWDTQAQATPTGQLVFFTEFLATAGVFDVHARISEPEFAGQARVPGTLVLAALAGHRRYAHVTYDARAPAAGRVH